MAFDKLVDSAKLDAALTATADAIRAKTGSTEPIPWDAETGFKTTVESMEVGGGGGTEWESLMPATDITFTNGGEYISFDVVYPLTLEKQYKVKWDNSEYVLTATETIFNDMPCVAVGNVGALVGNPDNVPFVIGYIPSVNGFGIIRIDGADEAVSVAIYKEKSAVVEGAHTVTFMSEDGSTVIGTKAVMHGDTCGDPTAIGLFPTPTKASTAQYNYSFYGWSTTANGAADDTALEFIVEDKTLYANFASAVRYYTINYYDGDTLLKSERLAYGATPSYEPVKDMYEFAGWTPDITSVTSDAAYYAEWESATITFADSSWSEINRVCEAGNAESVFAVGDERVVTNGTDTYTLRIIGLNLDEKTDGSGKAGITIMAYPLVSKTKAQWASAPSSTPWNNLTYGDSYKWVSRTFPATLPEELTQYVKETTHPTAVYNDDKTSVVMNSKYFIPSLYETGLSYSSFNASDDSGIVYPGLNSVTQRKLKTADGTVQRWWLRNNYGNKQSIMSTDGTCTAVGKDNEHYNAPCFCI